MFAILSLVAGLGAPAAQGQESQEELARASLDERTGVSVLDPLVCDELRAGRVPAGYTLVVLADGDLPGHNGIDEAVVGRAVEERDVVALGDTDVFCGDIGNDEVNLLAGSPIVHGEGGDDQVRPIDGAAGHFFGGEGHDGVSYHALSGGVRTVLSSDGSGETTLADGQVHFVDSIDWWSGSQAGDVLDASALPYRIRAFGLGGDDTITGNEFSDLIKGGFGSNTLLGLGAKDHIYSTGSSDNIDGGADSGWGDDILDMRDYIVGPITITFDDAGGVIDHPDGQTRFVNFRHIISTIEDDVIDGTNGPDVGVFLAGSKGDDTITGTPGVDRIAGNAGNDTCIHQPGDTTETCETVTMLPPPLSAIVGFVTESHRADASRAAIDVEAQFADFSMNCCSSHMLVAGFDAGRYGTWPYGAGHNQGVSFLRDVEVDGQLYARVAISATGKDGNAGLVLNAAPIASVDDGYDGDPGCCRGTLRSLGTSIYYEPWQNILFPTRAETQIAGLTRIPAGDTSGGSKLGNYHHPGGIQAIGDYLVVAMEQGADGAPAGVYILRADELELELVNSMTLGGTKDDSTMDLRAAASAGLTKLVDETYLLAISGRDHGSEGVWFYRSTTADLETTEWTFLDFWVPPLRCDLASGNVGPDCFVGGGGGTSLITDTDGTVYAVFTTGTNGFGPGSEYEYYQVMRLGLAADGVVEMTAVAQRGRSVGWQAIDNLSFRWAGSAQVDSTGRIHLASTKRLSRNNLQDTPHGPIEVAVRTAR